ncbi:MAG TPA: hypothetical protein VJC03_06030, partial [bacterium]|nr:hypothetical protein [bacterium]
MGERNAGAVEKNILKLDPAEIAEKTARGTPLDDGTRHLLESAEEYRELGIRVLLEDTGEAGPAAGENADGVGLFRTASFYRSPGKNEKFIPDSFESFRAVIKENVLVLIRSFQEMPLALQLLEFPSTEKETAVLFSVFCELVKEGHKILAEILLPAPA